MALMKAEDWVHMKKLQPNDFMHPEKMQFSAVNALDKFALMLGQKPQVLSDWRPYNPENPGSKHPEGIAIDTFWPNLSGEYVYQIAEKSGLFDGIGIYVNEKGVSSFHTDTRGERARWGGIISRVTDPDTLKQVKQIDYVDAQTVLDMLKKKSVDLIRSDRVVRRDYINNVEKQINQQDKMEEKETWLGRAIKMILELILKLIIKMMIKMKS